MNSPVIDGIVEVLHENPNGFSLHDIVDRLVEKGVEKEYRDWLKLKIVLSKVFVVLVNQTLFHFVKQDKVERNDGIYRWKRGNETKTTNHTS